VRRDQLSRLHAFADAFHEINRRVCIEANSAYHFGKLPSS
jgi:mRNA degradation ribonuclease J1/J2